MSKGKNKEKQDGTKSVIIGTIAGLATGVLLGLPIWSWPILVLIGIGMLSRMYAKDTATRKQAYGDSEK